MGVRGIFQRCSSTSLAFIQAGCIAVLFLLAAVSPAQDKSTATPTPTPETVATPLDDGPMKVQTDLVTLTLTVQDKWGRTVANLSKKHFAVFEDGVEQDITFFSDTDAPVSVAIVYDVSGSMGSGGKIVRSRRALERFMLTSHPSDEYSLITFSDKPHLLADRTRNPNAILDSLTFVKPGGNTAFYDGVYLGVDRVIRGSHSKRAVIVISDGQDNNSRYSYAEMRRLLKESDVVIYAIGIYDTNDGDLGTLGESFLNHLAESTGGKAFYPGVSDGSFDEICERIAIELRHQYSIGYTPKDFRLDGKWRRLKVAVKPPRGMPRLSVRARDGYFATPLMPTK